MKWTRTLKKYWWVGVGVVVLFVAIGYARRSGPPESEQAKRRGPIGYGMGSAPYKGGSVQTRPEALRKVGGATGGYGPQAAACCSACGHSGGKCSD